MALPQYQEAYVSKVPRLQLGFEDAACALALPLSTLEQIHRRGEGPLFFRVGRRLFTTPDLIFEWQKSRIAQAKAEAV